MAASLQRHPAQQHTEIRGRRSTMSDEMTGPYQPPRPPPLAGARFTPGQLLAGRYRVVALLGKGGMGEVYRADDLKLGQSVALKFLPSHLVADSDRMARFHSEVRLARQVSHPNVPAKGLSSAAFLESRDSLLNHRPDWVAGLCFSSLTDHIRAGVAQDNRPDWCRSALARSSSSYFPNYKYGRIDSLQVSSTTTSQVLLTESVKAGKSAANFR
jgi:hypothetical protein